MKFATLFILFIAKENLCQKLCEDYYTVKQHKITNYAVISIPHLKNVKWVTLNISIGANGNVYNNNRYLKLYKSKNETLTDILNEKQIKYKLNFPRVDGNITVKRISLNGNVLCFGSDKFFTNNWSFEHSFLLGKTSIMSERFSNTEEIYPKFTDWIFAQRKQLNIGRIHHKYSQKPTDNEIDITKENNKDIKAMEMRNKDVDTMKENEEENDKLWVRKLKCERERRLVPTQLILNGVIVKRGEFPWLVYFEYYDKNLICGGSLISDRHIITAAHCVQNYPRAYVVTRIHLGRYNRTDLDEYGAMTRTPKKVDVHHEYDIDKGSAHADIALVTIDPVPLSPMISPVCIWPYDPTTARKFGVTAGWGVTLDDGLPSTVPMKSTFPLVSLEKCRQSHPELAKLATNHTFCAGGGTSGPCYGDSGSGLYVFQNNTYYLRGIVSSSLSRDGTSFCSVRDYSVYVDIAYYLDWLHQHMSDLL